MKKNLLICAVSSILMTAACSTDNQENELEFHEKNGPVHPIVAWKAIKAIVAKIPPVNFGKISTYNGGCVIGQGFCLASNPKKPVAKSINETEINELNASEAYNTSESCNLIIDVIDEKNARIWMSSDLSQTNYSNDDFTLFGIDEIEIENIKLTKGVYTMEVRGNYFTYIVPYEIIN